MAKGTTTYTLKLDTKEFSGPVKVAQKDFEAFVSSLSQGAGSFGKVASAAGPVGVAVAAAVGVATGAAAAFAKVTLDAAQAAVDFAGKVSDLSTKTGISGEALQKLQFAGGLVGTSMEEAATAVQKLQQHMVAAPEDFKQLGLSIERLRTLAPEKQFEAVGRAIQSIQDPAQKTAATIAFFGKSGQEAMKLLSLDLEATGKQAEKLGIIMGDSQREALDALGDSVTTLGTTWEHLLMNWGGAIAQAPEVRQLVEDLTTGIGNLSTAVLKNKDLISSWVGAFVGGLGEIGRAFQTIASNPVYQKLVLGSASVAADMLGLRQLAYGAALLGQGGGPKAGSGTGHMAAGSSYAAITAAAAGASKAKWIDPAVVKAQAAEAARIAKQLAEDMKRDAEALSRFRHQTAMLELKENEEFWNRQRDMASEYGQWYLAYLTSKQAGEKAIADAWAAIQEEAHQEALAGLREIASAFDDVGGSVGHFAADSLRVLANLNDEALRAASGWQKLSLAIQGAVAAYNAGKSAGSPGKGALAGAGKGAAAGAAFGPYGAIIGGVIGAGIGFFGGKKAQKEELAALRSELAQVQEAARQAGLTLSRSFNTNSAVAMKQAIDEINKALGLQTAANEALHDAMDRYGISIGQLGPTFAKQELDKQAAQLLQDYNLLNAAGVDHNTILTQMGPNLNEYVQQSLAAGTAIPESMRPIIQGLIDQGLLLDQNGQAYTSVEQAGISFSATMSEQFGTLISKINELVSALLGIPNIERTVTVNRRYTNSGDPGDGGEDGDPATPLAGGFEGMVTRPRTFLVGEAGPEYMSVRKAGDRNGAGGLDLSALRSELAGLRGDMQRRDENLPRALRDALVMSRN